MEQVKLTNMCMIYDEKTKQVVIQDRVKDWKGITFPGGKIEIGEAIIPSTIREIKEETGLTISNLKFCGIKDWYDYQKEERYLVFLLKTSTFEGKLIKETEEGKVFWCKLEDITKYQLSNDFEEMLTIFLEENTEFFYHDNKINSENRWEKELY